MTDKSNFTPDEWKLLLESVMMTSLAVTAAKPSGLWGLLEESFAGSTELAKAKIHPNSNALIKAVVADFGTTDGRSIARDGLKKKLTGRALVRLSRPSQSSCSLDSLLETDAEADVLRAIKRKLLFRVRREVPPRLKV